MRASRGMGAIAPSKVPKLIKKRDGNEPVKVFKQGGKVKKFGLGGILVPVDPITQQAIPKNIQQSKFYDPVGTKMGFDTERNKMKDVNEAEQEAAMQADINRRWKNGGKVSEAGNYTKPGLRKRIFNSVKAAAVQGTGAGQWSARKAQLMAKRYKAAGGGYKD